MPYRKNVGTIESWGRIAFGVGLAVFGVWRHGTALAGWLAAGGGTMVALTGAFGWCPACALVDRKEPSAP